MKRVTALFLILTMCLGLMTACGSDKDEIPTEDVELWVVTERTWRYRMNDQAERIIEQFKEMYPNVTVKLDILPTDDEEREVYLTKLRTQIMAGAGPDVYLMPTYSYVPESTNANANLKKVELLFQNVEASMYNGLFYDISDYYDADESLEKEELNTSVMDGGVLDGARYILPLRYNIGVYLVDPENFEALGCDASVFEQGADDVVAMALEKEDPILTYAAMPRYTEYYLGDYMDYASGEVLITEDEVAEYLRNYQLAYSMYLQSGIIWEYCAHAGGYINFFLHFTWCGFGMYGATLDELVGAMATAKVVGEELEMYPILAADGTLNATIHYYAAVGAGSDHPRLAYEFVKQFLSDEAQYESYLTEPEYIRSTYDAWYGWPVRTVGSVEPRLATLRARISREVHSDAGEKKRQSQFESEQLTLTDADIPALTWEVDGVIFPTSGDIGIDLVDFSNLMLDFENDYAPRDVDFNAYAREYIENLQRHLQED